MSPQAGKMLLDGVLPILRSVIGRGKVKAFGCEDAEELESDAVAQAAAIIESAEREGKEVGANSVAFYALRGLQSGRRFGCSSGDLMSPALRLSGKVEAVDSLDAPIGCDGEDDEPTLLDFLASRGDDPATAGAREIDWNAATEVLEQRELEILCATAAGHMATEMATRFSVSKPRITQIKRCIGEKLRRTLGDDALASCVCESPWQAGMRAYQERRACRYEAVQAQ